MKLFVFLQNFSNPENLNELELIFAINCTVYIKDLIWLYERKASFGVSS